MSKVTELTPEISEVMDRLVSFEQFAYKGKLYKLTPVGDEKTDPLFAHAPKEA